MTGDEPAPPRPPRDPAELIRTRRWMAVIPVLSVVAGATLGPAKPVGGIFLAATFLIVGHLGSLAGRLEPNAPFRERFLTCVVSGALGSVGSVAFVAVEFVQGAGGFGPRGLARAAVICVSAFVVATGVAGWALVDGRKRSRAKGPPLWP